MTARVLLISAEYPPLPGGIGDYTALLATHLAAESAMVSVLTSGTSEYREDGGVSVYGAVRRWDWGIARIVRKAIASVRPDVVHLQYQTGMYQMHPAINVLPGRVRSCGCRVVTTFHDLRHPYLFPKAGPVRSLVTRHLARASDAAIATNGADEATLKRWHANALLIPIGSSIPAATGADTAAVRRRFGIAPGAVLLTTFGLINQSKGLETLIEALALLRRDGVNAHLLFVGVGAGVNDPTNRQTEATVVARCAALGLAQSVTQTGALDARDVAQALAASDVCLLPYRDGASPRRSSLLAALTQGIPVVTTTPLSHMYDGLPELRDHEEVLLVPPGNARALADAACRILHDGVLAARLRAGAAAHARLFAWPSIARQTLAVYATIGAADMKSRPVETAVSGAEH